MAKKTNNNYFTQETEDAIVYYNSITDPDLRAKIFSDKIYFPFYKLAENIIHTFKFYYTDVDDVEDLKHKIITLLLEEKIDKFDPTKGAKAYSYFGTIVKRWLINYNNKNYKNLKKRGSFEEYEIEVIEQEEIEDGNLITLPQFIDNFVEECYKDLDNMFEKESDKKIADAILNIFKVRTDLDIFRKKALYIYIREMTDCKTPHLTYVISILKNKFYQDYAVLFEKGLIESR